MRAFRHVTARLARQRATHYFTSGRDERPKSPFIDDLVLDTGAAFRRHLARATHGVWPPQAATPVESARSPASPRLLARAQVSPRRVKSSANKSRVPPRLTRDRARRPSERREMVPSRRRRRASTTTPRNRARVRGGGRRARQSGDVHARPRSEQSRIGLAARSRGDDDEQTEPEEYADGARSSTVGTTGVDKDKKSLPAAPPAPERASARIALRKWHRARASRPTRSRTAADARRRRHEPLVRREHDRVRVHRHRARERHVLGDDDAQPRSSAGSTRYSSRV